MVANPKRITTLDTLSTDGIEDGIDKMHTGLLQALFCNAHGSKILECGAITEDTTGANTIYTIAADIFFKINEIEYSRVTDTSITMNAADATYDRYDFIYMDSAGDLNILSGVAAETPEVNQTITTDMVPIALVKIEAGVNGSSHPIQLYVGESGTNVNQSIKIKADEAITAGDPLYVSSNPSANLVRVGIADASDSTKMPVIGLANQSLSTGEEGVATVFGILKDLDTSTYLAADVGKVLYASTTGTLTLTKPTGTTHLIQNIGLLTRVHASSGAIFVTGIGRTNDVPNRTFITQGSDDLENSYQLQGGTGISLSTGGSGSSKTLTITNDSPDQAVTLNAGTGISTSGTHPTFTITNTAPDQTVTLTDGTGISTSGTYPNFTITNSSPDQTVSLTGAGITAITGTYPSFTITSTEADTLDSVLGRGNISSNDATVGTITSTVNQVVAFEVHNAITGPFMTGATTVVYVDDISTLVPPNQITLPPPSSGTILYIKNISPAPIDIIGNPVINLGDTTHPKITIANTISLQPYEHVTLQSTNDAQPPLVAGHMIISD